MLTDHENIVDKKNIWYRIHFFEAQHFFEIYAFQKKRIWYQICISMKHLLKIWIRLYIFICDINVEGEVFRIHALHLKAPFHGAPRFITIEVYEDRCFYNKVNFNFISIRNNYFFLKLKLNFVYASNWCFVDVWRDCIFKFANFDYKFEHFETNLQILSAHFGCKFVTKICIKIRLQK